MANDEWPAPDCAPLEVKAYSLDATPAEIQALRDQIYVYAPGIIKFTEAPMLSAKQFDVYEVKMHELAAEIPEFQLLIDLTNVVIRPDAKERARLKSIFHPISHQVTQCAVCTGKNFLLNMAAKFILGGLGFASLTVHKTRAEALEALGYEP